MHQWEGREPIIPLKAIQEKEVVKEFNENDTGWYHNSKNDRGDHSFKVIKNYCPKFFVVIPYLIIRLRQ